METNSKYAKWAWLFVPWSVFVLFLVVSHDSWSLWTAHPHARGAELLWHLLLLLPLSALSGICYFVPERLRSLAIALAGLAGLYLMFGSRALAGLSLDYWRLCDGERTLVIIMFGLCHGAVSAWASRGERVFRVSLLYFAMGVVLTLCTFSSSWGVLFGGVLLVLAALGAGRLLCGGPALTATEGATPQYPLWIVFSVGLAALSLLVFCLNYCHVGYGYACVMVLACLSIPGVSFLVTRGNKPGRDWGLRGESSGALLMLCLLCVLCCLAPEVGPDSMGGRLALPQKWAQSGHMVGNLEMHLSSMGAAGEMLVQSVCAVAGLSSVKLVQMVCLVVVVIAGCSLSSAKSLPAALVWVGFCGGTIVLLQFAWGFVDLIQVCVSVAALYLLSDAQAGFTWRRVVLCGGLIGTATAIKMTGVFLLPIAVWCVISDGIRTRQKGAAVFRLLLCGGAGFVFVVSFWFIHSWLNTGNPLFPYANTLFKSPMAEPAVVQVVFGHPLSFQSLILLPYRLCLELGRYGEIGQISPYFLLLLPLFVYSFWLPRARYWASVALVLWLLWFVSSPNLRYALLPLFCSSVALALCVDAVYLKLTGTFRRVFIAVAVLVLCIGEAQLLLKRDAWAWRNSSDGFCFPLAYGLGKESGSQYLARTTQYCLLADVYNTRARDGDVLWMFPFERDHLYFKGRVISHPHGDNRVLTPLASLFFDDKPDESHRETLHRFGVTHLLFKESGAEYYGNNPGGDAPSSAWSGLLRTSFLEGYCDFLAGFNGLRLYRLRDSSPEARIQWRTIAPTVRHADEFKVTAGGQARLEMRYQGQPKNRESLVVLHWRDLAGRTFKYSLIKIPASEGEAVHGSLFTIPPPATSFYVEFRDVSPSVSISFAIAIPE